ncbi:NADH-cytochrome b5 reductase-like protein [Diplonema papillatum]|nr:NADH-cytochrome b5 reductase-like protein [Diplonema papillatum]
MSTSTIRFAKNAWKVSSVCLGGYAAWYLGGKAGDMVFGQEGSGHFLKGRSDRYEDEHPIFNFTYNKPKHEVELCPDEWRKYPLELKKTVGKNMMVLRFQLPSVHGSAGTHSASYVLLRYRDADGKYVVRPYTPISMEWEHGFFDLMVKKYPDAKMGTHLDNMKVGDRIDVKGPFQNIKVDPNMWAEIGCIAGGSGITPCWQIMMALAKHPQNRTNMNLIYANNSPEDIMMKRHLENLQLAHFRVRTYHTVLEAGTNWKGGLGYINKDMIAAKMPKPGEGKIFVCGPDGLMDAVCGKKVKYEQGPLGGMLKEMGYTEDDVFKL